MINRIKMKCAWLCTKWRDFSRDYPLDTKKMGIVSLVLLVFIILYAFSKGSEVTTKKIISSREGEFKKSKILGDPYAASGQAKEKIWAKTAKEYAEAQKSFGISLGELTNRMAAIESRIAAPSQATAAQPEPAAIPQSQTGNLTNSSRLEEMTSAHEPEAKSQVSTSPMLSSPVARVDWGQDHREKAKGPVILTFPVDGKEIKEKTEVTLPLGSYVKAKLLTGVEAPEGVPYPVLLQLDFANILPNRKSLDLKGCFMIAKAQGDLSTERVQMQATKLSCVARDGHMFERDINGFVADGVDNSFAVIGSVNTKQDRVAAMAFLSSVVEGVGKAIQMAQTTEQTSAEGNSRRLLTGDQGKYITAGGASQAAGMVAQWYLKQAQNLLPTINVGSGKDVWVVMNDSVALPSHYFKKQTAGANHEKDYSFVNRLFD